MNLDIGALKAKQIASNISKGGPGSGRRSKSEAPYSPSYKNTPHPEEKGGEEYKKREEASQQVVNRENKAKEIDSKISSFQNTAEMPKGQDAASNKRIEEARNKIQSLKEEKNNLEKAAPIFTGAWSPQWGTIPANIVKADSAQQAKVSKVMDEFKDGSLKSSAGNKVTSKDQAIAIALSEAGLRKSKYSDKLDKMRARRDSDGIEKAASEKQYSDMIIINEEGEILLLKRSKRDSFGAGKWCLPGGTVDPGENPRIAVIREVMEETGITCCTDPLFITSIKNDNGSESNYFYSNMSDPNQHIMLVEEEHDQYEWFSMRNLLSQDLLLDLKNRIMMMKDSFRVMHAHSFLKH